MRGGVIAGPTLRQELWILVLAGVLIVEAPAQKEDLSGYHGAPQTTTYQTAPGTAVIRLHVFAEKAGNRLDRPARLDLTNLGDNSGVFQTIEGDAEGVFTNIAYGHYGVEVSAVGYFPAHQEVQILSSLRPLEIEIVLHRDPSAVKLDFSAAALSPKARKAARNGLSLLQAGYFEQARKELEKAYNLAPENSDLNFLLGDVYFQQKDYGKAVDYLSSAQKLSPHNAQALILLGRANLAQQDYPAARSALEQAVLVDGDDWLPHNLLADTYLREKTYDKARAEAEIAIQKGQRAKSTVASPAEVVLGQALIGLGQNQLAVETLARFLKEAPQNPLAYQVRALVAQLKKNESNSGESPGAPDGVAARADPLAAVPEPELSTRAWRPPDIDDTKPTFAAGVTCPAAEVIQESGKRVEEFAQDLSRFAADEDLFHQSMDAFGISTRTETRKYEYVAMVSEPHPGAVSIDEFRSDKGTQPGDPDAIQSTGFITLALVFHPDMQKDFEFVCEGQSDWRGQTSWIVHFRQRRDRPNRMHSYRVRDQNFPVDLKGRAWITADKFQIVRVEADMVEPIPAISLLSEHQTVEYGPVPFPKKNTTLWLPKHAEIYIDLHRHHYYRRHSLDHYLLFSVDTEEKPKVPQTQPGKESSAEKDAS
jgi:tetratricopeptide (TPR) repeat protein